MHATSGGHFGSDVQGGGGGQFCNEPDLASLNPLSFNTCLRIARARPQLFEHLYGERFGRDRLYVCMCSVIQQVPADVSPSRRASVRAWARTGMKMAPKTTRYGRQWPKMMQTGGDNFEGKFDQTWPTMASATDHYVQIVSAASNKDSDALFHDSDEDSDHGKTDVELERDLEKVLDECLVAEPDTQLVEKALQCWDCAILHPLKCMRCQLDGGAGDNVGPTDNEDCQDHGCHEWATSAQGLGRMFKH